MPMGTPKDYEAARAAEISDDVALEYHGRGKLDVHAAVGNTLAFDDIMTAQGLWRKRMLYLPACIETVRANRNRLAELAKNAGLLLMEGFSSASGFGHDNDPVEESDEPMSGAA